MPIELAKTRIVKKLAPDQPGAVKLTRRFGEALVCVRYRHDHEQGKRYTTVELLVEEADLPTNREQKTLVQVALNFNETELRKAACAAGAEWDKDAKTWRMSKLAARKMGLLDRIRPARPPVASKSSKS